MHCSDRRHFLRTGIAAAASTAFAGIAPRRTFAESGKFTRIAYRELGSTGCLVSEVGFGAMNMRDKAVGALARTKEDVSDFMAEVEYARSAKKKGAKQDAEQA